MLMQKQVESILQKKTFCQQKKSQLVNACARRRGHEATTRASSAMIEQTSSSVVHKPFRHVVPEWLVSIYDVC